VTLAVVLIEAFRYHKWANLHLLDVCAKLPIEELQLTVPGTYGTIAKTFHHMAPAEQRYTRRFGAGDPRIRESDAFPGLPVLREHLERSGDQLIEAAGRIKGDELSDGKDESGTFQVQLGIVLVQALHHGNDHRTQICTILGHHGIPYGDMDVWAYGIATGGFVWTTKT
jgi:uncharacterized damage-inducible protein DinB